MCPWTLTKGLQNHEKFLCIEVFIKQVFWLNNILTQVCSEVILTGFISFIASANPILNSIAFNLGTSFLMEDIWKEKKSASVYY